MRSTVTTAIELVSLALILGGVVLVALVALWAALLLAGVGGLLLSRWLTQ